MSEGSELSPPNAKKWCHTEVKVHKFNFTWTIANFSYCPEDLGQSFESSTFSTGNSDRLKWCLKLYPMGADQESKDHVSLYLILVSSTVNDRVSAKYKFSILDGKREEKNVMSHHRQAQTFYEVDGNGFPKFAPRTSLCDNANNLLPDDTLTISCEVSVMENHLSSSSGSGARSVCQPPPPVARKWCHTQAEFCNFDYTWTVGNFSFLSKNVGESVKSSPFSSGQNDEVTWRMEMYPNGQAEDCKDHLSLALVLEASDKDVVPAKFDVSVLNSKGKTITRGDSRRVWKFRQHLKPSAVFPRFGLRCDLLDEAKGLLPDDRLTVVCKVSFVADWIQTSGQSSSEKIKVPDCKLLDDLGRLLEAPRFADVTVVCQGREFRCMKGLLAARSKVFAAMFQHDMEESKRNRVEVKDVDPPVMDQLLRYVYTGTAPELEKRAIGLLAAADKYGLERLKAMCEESLCNSLTMDNVCEIAALADLHSAEQLKAKAIKFIVSDHLKDIKKTAGWNQIALSSPHLVAIVVSSLDLLTASRAR